MSADKHRNLGVRVAYLRLAARDGGLGLNIQWAHKLTKLLKSMADDGEVTLRRSTAGRTGGKNVTCAYITPKGQARLNAALDRFGPDFGPTSLARSAEPSTLKKFERRKRKDAAVQRARTAAALANRRSQSIARAKYAAPAVA